MILDCILRLSWIQITSSLQTVRIICSDGDWKLWAGEQQETATSPTRLAWEQSETGKRRCKLKMPCMALMLPYRSPVGCRLLPAVLPLPLVLPAAQ